MRLHFLNAEAENAHQWMEKALPGTERDYSSFSRDNSRAIVFAHNNRNPGVYCALNFTTRKVTIIGPACPAINPAIMAPSRRFNFAASDGLTITGRVTLPSGVEKPPLILMVGPNTDGPRSRATFDPVAQFFASRGYATARIDHRGTFGFGRDFSAAGDFQIATGMVRDLAEGVKWLGDQGWIDNKRMAVFADGWGGLTAFPLAATPGLFRALINFDTPMDLGDVDLRGLSPSGRSKDDLIAAIGGSTLARTYPKTVDPLAVAGQLTIPSFHYYSLVRNGLGTEFVPGGVSKLVSLLKKNGQAHQISYAKNSAVMKDDGLVPWKEKAKTYEALAAFLREHL
jgi:pimeloyl-ACP methyl ester carboxylesterase